MSIAVNPASQGRSQRGNVGELVVAEGAGVAGRIVSKRMESGIELQSVEPIAAKCIEARIAGNAVQLRVDRGHVEGVDDALVRAGGAGQRKRGGLAGPVGGIGESESGNVGSEAHGALAGEVQKRRSREQAVVLKEAEHRAVHLIQIEAKGHGDRFRGGRPLRRGDHSPVGDLKRPRRQHAVVHPLRTVFNTQRAGGSGTRRLKPNAWAACVNRAWAAAAFAEAVDIEAEKLGRGGRNCQLDAWRGKAQVLIRSAGSAGNVRGSCKESRGGCADRGFQEISAF